LTPRENEGFFNACERFYRAERQPSEIEDQLTGKAKQSLTSRDYFAAFAIHQNASTIVLLMTAQEVTAPTAPLKASA
jgi:hypothetical protein